MPKRNENRSFPSSLPQLTGAFVKLVWCASIKWMNMVGSWIFNFPNWRFPGRRVLRISVLASCSGPSLCVDKHFAEWPREPVHSRWESVAVLLLLLLLLFVAESWRCNWNLSVGCCCAALFVLLSSFVDLFGLVGKVGNRWVCVCHRVESECCEANVMGKLIFWTRCDISFPAARFKVCYREWRWWVLAGV